MLLKLFAAVPLSWSSLGPRPGTANAAHNLLQICSRNASCSRLVQARCSLFTKTSIFITALEVVCCWAGELVQLGKRSEATEARQQKRGKRSEAREGRLKKQGNRSEAREARQNRRGRGSEAGGWKSEAREIRQLKRRLHASRINHVQVNHVSRFMCTVALYAIASYLGSTLV